MSASLSDTLRTMRAHAARTLIETLNSIAEESHSEYALTETWARYLYEDASILPSGWYDPPPNGLAILAGAPPRYERSKFKTLRSEEFWPSRSVIAMPDSLFYCYCSPIHRRTGLIGDLGITLCQRPSPTVAKHIRNCYRITMEICEQARPGMKFSELYEWSSQRIRAYGLENDTLSVTNPVVLDIGHTVPWSYEDMSEGERSVMNSGTHDGVCKLVSRKRVFVSPTENYVIPDTCAFTVEPRLTNDDLPLASVHAIVCFERGEKHVIREFDPVLSALDMSYVYD